VAFAIYGNSENPPLHRRFQFLLRLLKGFRIQVAESGANGRFAPAGPHHHGHPLFLGQRNRPTRDPEQPIRQQTYFRALRTLPNLTIHLGYFKAHQVRMPLVNPPAGGPNMALVWRTDEKGSDVNLATQMLVDGFEGAYDCAVLVTNDSDLLGPIHAVRQKLGKKVGLLNPQKRPARALHGEVDFYKKIREGVLGASQFPSPLSDANGTFHKPPTW
jgi:hypothetical protein